MNRPVVWIVVSVLVWGLILWAMSPFGALDWVAEAWQDVRR